ncbi:MAG: hypothetical protein V2A58_02990 [Planctomycetota bacterium]
MPHEKTYDRPLDPDRTSIGVEEFLIASYPCAFQVSSPPAARVAVSSPPPGWKRLGRVEDGSAEVRLERAPTRYHGGPSGELLYQRAELTLARVSFRIQSLSSRDVRYAWGDGSSANLYGVDPLSDATTITSVVSAERFVLAGPIAGCSWVVISPVSSLGSSDNDSRVSSLSADGTELFLASPPAEAPSPGWAVARLYGTRQSVGPDDRREFSLLGVADTVDGWQILHYFPRVVAAGRWRETISPDRPASVELQFDVCAVSSLASLLLFERYAVAP